MNTPVCYLRHLGAFCLGLSLYGSDRDHGISVIPIRDDRDGHDGVTENLVGICVF